MRIIKSRKRQTQILAVLVVTFFFIVGINLLSSKSQSSHLQQNLSQVTDDTDNQKDLNTPKTPPTLTLDQFTRKSIKDGKTEWELLGQAVEMFSEDELAKIKDPNLKIFSSQDQPILITSDSALVNFTGKDIHQADLNQNVLIVNEELELKTSKAKFYKSSNTVTAPHHVEINTNNSKINGKNLTANLTTEDIEIKEDVDSLIQHQNKEGDEVTTKEIIVTSKSLEFNNQTTFFNYQENVYASQEDYIINCDQLKGRFNENQELEELVALGNVVITQGEKLRTRSDRADFDFKKDEIVLTGNPELEQNKNLVKADLIHYNTKTEKSRAEGEVFVTLLEQG